MFCSLTLRIEHLRCSLTLRVEHLQFFTLQRNHARLGESSYGLNHARLGESSYGLNHARLGESSYGLNLLDSESQATASIMLDSGSQATAKRIAHYGPGTRTFCDYLGFLPKVAWAVFSSLPRLNLMTI